MKKLLALLLGLLLILPYSITSAGSPSSTPENAAFPDLEGDDPSIEAINYLAENDVVEGYPDGTFQSLNKINRAEFMKIVVEAATDDASGENCFPDVNDEWFAKYICYAKEQGWVDGYPDGTFQPANEINFAEASKIVANAFGIEGAELDSTDPWYREFVEPLADAGAIPTSISDLDKSIARGEMAEVIWRVDAEETDLDSLKYEELEGEPVEIESCEALVDLFASDPYYYEVYDYAEDEEAAPSDGDTGSETMAEGGGGGAADYSTTNIQVTGVDEADFVKNDDEYIYMIRDYSVRIIDAYPAEEMTEVAMIEFEDESFYPEELYVDGDTLVVEGSTYNYDVYDYGFEGDIYFPYYHQYRAAVYIYDISDPTAPELERSLEFDGSKTDTRKVDDTLYMVLTKWDFGGYYYNYDPAEIDAEELLPRFYDSLTGEETTLADCTDIRYFPRERDLNYLITLAIPLNSDEEVESEVMIGSSENIYASRENLYVAATNYDSVYDYYYDWENAKTVVYRFDLEPGSIEYEARGKVTGTILDQFSMDEYNDHFRIATTHGSLWEGTSQNNVYVLDEDMNQVGAIENLAPGETIYSTRFSGDRGYMVTFKKIDPLFVFDLSDPENPEVVGELKIPGYSDYLHPYGTDYLIGFGKDAEDPTEEQDAATEMDFAWYQGMKIALFDITDPTNPEQLYSVNIGDRGTESELLWDHKALLFDESKNLLAFPVTVAEVADEEAPPETYGEFVYQGAYVYDLTIEEGFDLQGTVTHYTDEELDQIREGGYWYYQDYLKEVKRVLYIGEYLYTVSSKMVKANDLETLEEVNAIDIEGEDYNYYYEY